MDGSILINRGTIRGRVQLGDWDNDAEMGTNVLINYGTMYGDSVVGYDNDSYNAVVNLGTLGIPQSQFRQTSFYKLGTLLHGAIAPEGETPLITTEEGGDYYIDLFGCYFYSGGEIVMEGQSREKDSRIDMAVGTRFVNAGSIRMGSYGEIRNHATLFNYGEIAATESTAGINNSDWLLNAGADCALDTAHCDNIGMIQAGLETSVNLAAFRDSGALLPFSGWDPQILDCQVTNYGELSANENLSIGGSVVNYGFFRVWCGQDTLIRVSGSLENHGTLEFNSGRENVIAQFQPWAAGTVTGVPEQYVAN